MTTTAEKGSVEGATREVAYELHAGQMPHELDARWNQINELPAVKKQGGVVVYVCALAVQ
jgi:hypothetical protein